MKTICLIHGIGGGIGALVHGFCAVVSIHIALGLIIKEPRGVCVRFCNVGSHMERSIRVFSYGCKVGKIDMQDRCYLQLMHPYLSYPSVGHLLHVMTSKQRKELRHGPSYGHRCITMRLAGQASGSLHRYSYFFAGSNTTYSSADVQDSRVA